MSTTRVRGFAPWKPQPDTLAILDQVQAVLNEYHNYLPMTVRQIFYRLVANRIFEEKDGKAYDSLCEKLNRARRAQLIPFNVIRDDSFYDGWLAPVYGYDHAVACVRSFASNRILDRQRGQARPLSVWCEARGMVDMLEKLANQYGVPVMSSGGFDSVTTQHQMGKELAQTDGLILHLGDYDPSGVHMFTALEENILAFADAYGGLPELKRIAVIPEQITEYGLPHKPPKMNKKGGWADNRRFHDYRTVQLEAFAPDELENLLTREIELRMDLDIYQNVIDEETVMREDLMKWLT